jgi:hypothetical protein
MLENTSSIVAGSKNVAINYIKLFKSITYGIRTVALKIFEVWSIFQTINFITNILIIGMVFVEAEVLSLASTFIESEHASASIKIVA